MHYFAQSTLEIEYKTDRTLITEADLASDHLITAAIHSVYPEEPILSEELFPQTINQGLGKGAGQPQTIWVVDPLDGTTNFSLGLHYWGVLIAHVVEGWTDCAVMYYPSIDELYTAKSGQGACLNGERISAGTALLNDRLSFFSCCSRTYQQYEVHVPYKTRILGSAGYSLCNLARGKALLAFEAAAKIWDIAAGWLLVQEAGGCIETLDGSQPFPLKPDIDYNQQIFPTLAAAAPRLINRAREQIKTKE